MISCFVAAAVATGAGMVTAGPAAAATPVPPGTLGTLVNLDPATGTDLTAPHIKTSAGCSDAISTSYEMRIFGPIDVPDAQKVFNPDYPITTNTSADFSKTDPFPIAFNNTFKDAAAQRSKVIIPGQYTLTANCFDDFSNIGGTFTSSVTFTDATHYKFDGTSAPTPTAQPPGSGTPTPTPPGTPTPSTTPAPSGTPAPSTTPTPSNTPTPTPTPSGTPTPSTTPTPTDPPISTPTPTPVAGTGGTGTGGTGTGGGQLAFTGAPVATLAAGGLSLSTLGIVLLLAARRRRTG